MLFLDAFSDAIFEASDAILKPLGTYFGSLWAACLAFSYLSSFLKIELACGRELKNQGPRVNGMPQKSNTNCPGLWACFGKRVQKENIPLWLEK